MLVVADYDSDAVLRIDPATGAQSILSQGNLLQGHTGLALEADGHILVADTGWQGGGLEVIRIDPVTGTQSIVTSGGLLSVCSGVVSVVPLGSQDTDGDGVPDTDDNCPILLSAQQSSLMEVIPEFPTPNPKWLHHLRQDSAVCC